jgi:hypothetical protein
VLPNSGLTQAKGIIGLSEFLVKESVLTVSREGHGFWFTPGLSEHRNRSARRGEEAPKSQNVFPKIKTLARKKV